MGIQRGTRDKRFPSIIGAGWQHEDGSGININLLPLAGPDIVIRRVKPKTASDQIDDILFVTRLTKGGASGRRSLHLPVTRLRDTGGQE